MISKLDPSLGLCGDCLSKGYERRSLTQHNLWITPFLIGCRFTSKYNKHNIEFLVYIILMNVIQSRSFLKSF